MSISKYNTVGPGGVATLTPPHSNFVNSYTLLADTAKTITWPAGSQFCNISATADYWVQSAEGTAAAIPATNITDGTAPALNPAQRQRGEGVQIFSIISHTQQQISIEFWG